MTEQLADSQFLAGRTAVVTGAGRGIGAEIARWLARAGASVLVSARTRAHVDAVAAEIADEGGTASAMVCDVADPAAIDALAAGAAERLGHVDVLVNNAGISGSSPLRRTSLEEWNRMLAVNATGTFLCTRAFLPGMLERRWGRIVNVASIAGLHGARYIAAYAASKHAVIGLTRCTAAEVAAHGVTANTVCPGYVETDMASDSVRRIVEKTGLSDEDALGSILETTPQRRLIQVDEVAAAVLHLCREEARGINGQNIVIDGGALLA